MKKYWIGTHIGYKMVYLFMLFASFFFLFVAPVFVFLCHTSAGGVRLGGGDRANGGGGSQKGKIVKQKCT